MFRWPRNEMEARLLTEQEILCDSLEIYFDIKGIHYYGPKKALRFMEESDSEAFHIYSKALLEFNQEGLSDWINYLKTIF